MATVLLFWNTNMHGHRDLIRSITQAAKNTSYKCNNGSAEDLRKLPTHTPLP